MAKSTNIEFNMLNPDTISRLIDDGEIKVPDKKVDVPKDERWNEKQMASKILQGLLNGDDMRTMSNSMTAVVGNNVNSAIRNTRTMVTSAENRGRLDSYENLSEQGLVMKKKWIATPDERTRASHLAIDGELQDLDKPFSNKCRFPGDGQGPAQEVWMCRCTMGTKVIGYRRADGSISYVGGGRTTSIHDMQMADERARRTTSTPAVTQSYSDRIRAIADDVAQNGLTSEKVMEAGHILADEVNRTLQVRYDKVAEAEQRLYDAGQGVIDNINNDEKYKEVVAIKRGLLYPDESVYWRNATDEEISRYFHDTLSRITDVKLSDDYIQASEALEVARRSLKGTFAENTESLFNTLSEIRPMGSEGIDLSYHLNNSRSQMRNVVESAYGFYPTSWIEASVRAGHLTPKKVDRGYYSHSESIIAISGDPARTGSATTAIHELGHRFERTVNGIREQEQIFYDRRTAGEELEWLGGNYRRDEKSRKDDFLSAYMGKDYGGSAYELVSMGFQYAYTDPTLLAKDPDMQAWILGLLSVTP